MAVKKEINDVKLQIRFENGLTASGKKAIKTMSLGNIKLDSTDQQLLEAGNAVSTLSSLPLEGVRRVEISDLAEGE